MEDVIRTANAIIEEYDWQVKELWNSAIEKCERESDAELLMRMQDCDFSLLSDGCFLLIDSLNSMSEKCRRGIDTALLLVDVLGIGFIRHQKDRLEDAIEMIDRIDRNQGGEDVRRRLYDRWMKMSILIDINNKMENNGAGK